MNWHHNWSEKTRYSWNLSSKPHASLNLLLDPRFAIIIQVPRDTTMGSRGFGCGKRMKRCRCLNTIEPSQKWMMVIIHAIRSDFFLFPPNFWHLGIAMELWWNLACDSLPFHSWIQCSFSRFLRSSRLNKPIAIRPCNQVLSPSEQYRYVHYNVYTYIYLWFICICNILYSILCIRKGMLRSAWYASLRASYTSLCLH